MNEKIYMPYYIKLRSVQNFISIQAKDQWNIEAETVQLCNIHTIQCLNETQVGYTMKQLLARSSHFRNNLRSNFVSFP